MCPSWGESLTLTYNNLLLDIRVCCSGLVLGGISMCSKGGVIYMLVLLWHVERRVANANAVYPTIPIMTWKRACASSKHVVLRLCLSLPCSVSC